MNIDIDDGFSARRAIQLVASVTLIAALYFGRELLIPLVLAAFICFLLAPFVRGLERLGIRRALSVLIVVSAAFGLVAGLGWIVATQASQLADDFVQYRERIVAKARALQSSVTNATNPIANAVRSISQDVGATHTAVSRPTGPTAALASAPEEKPVRVEVVPNQINRIAIIGSYIIPLVHPFATAGITTLFVIFFLVFREDLRDRILRLCGRAQINVTTSALTDSARRVTRYIMAQAAANGFIGLIVGLGLHWLGLPSAALWGLLTGVLRFVPYVGASIAAFFPVAQAIATFDGWWQPFAVLALALGTDVLSANILEPWLYGTQTGASPTALVVSFVFWTWLWGGIGLVLATPITVCLVALGKQIPVFEFFYILMGDEPVLEPKARFYQRLLAQDGREAARIVRQFARETSVLAACEQVILPALAHLERDRQSELLDEPRVAFVCVAIQELIEAMSEEITADADVEAEVMFVVERSAFDELVPAIIALAAGSHSARFRVMTKVHLAAEIVEIVRNELPCAIVLSAIEPRAVSRLRHVHRLLLDGHIVVPILPAVFSDTRDGLRVGSMHNLPGTSQTLQDLLQKIACLCQRAAPRTPIPA